MKLTYQKTLKETLKEDLGGIKKALRENLICLIKVLFHIGQNGLEFFHQMKKNYVILFLIIMGYQVSSYLNLKSIWYYCVCIIIIVI